MQRMISFTAGALCGAVVGAVTALLVTPVSGHDIQAEGRRRTERIVIEMHRAYEDKQAELQAHLDALKDQGLTQ